MTASEQARADAMADAETLRLLEPAVATWKRSEAGVALSEASFHGAGAVYSMGYRGECAVSVPALAAEQAQKAAHAAFRAVPGLRGE
jgi:hypothetical protein